MGTKNNPGEFDCYHKAEPDEPVFVLLGRDPCAAAVVRQWASLRAAALHKQPKFDGDAPAVGREVSKIAEAFAVAESMDDYRDAWRGARVSASIAPSVESVMTTYMVPTGDGARREEKRAGFVLLPVALLDGLQGATSKVLRAVLQTLLAAHGKTIAERVDEACSELVREAARLKVHLLERLQDEGASAAFVAEFMDDNHGEPTDPDEDWWKDEGYRRGLLSAVSDIRESL